MSKLDAVFVSFHFLAPQRPCETLVDAHQALLDRLPGLESAVALGNRAELAYLLTFSNQRHIDAYFAAPEFEQLSNQPGCNDVFIKTFSILPDHLERVAQVDVQTDGLLDSDAATAI